MYMVEYYVKDVLHRKGPYDSWFIADKLRNAFLAMVENSKDAGTYITNINVVIEEKLIPPERFEELKDEKQ